MVAGVACSRKWKRASDASLEPRNQDEPTINGISPCVSTKERPKGAGGSRLLPVHCLRRFSLSGEAACQPPECGQEW